MKLIKFMNSVNDYSIEIFKYEFTSAPSCVNNLISVKLSIGLIVSLVCLRA